MHKVLSHNHMQLQLSRMALVVASVLAGCQASCRNNLWPDDNLGNLAVA